jgi:glyoxylase I family protein
MTTEPQAEANARSAIQPIGDWTPGVGLHVGICVPDLEAAKAFYCDLLGFEYAWDITVSGEDLEKFSGIPNGSETCIQILLPGSGRIELQQYEPMHRVGQSAINNQGLNHLSFEVSDVWADYERLKARGVKFSSEPITIDNPGHALHQMQYVYFSDPWGLTLELMGPVPTA